MCFIQCENRHKINIYIIIIHSFKVKRRKSQPPHNNGWTREHHIKKGPVKPNDLLITHQSNNNKSQTKISHKASAEHKHCSFATLIYYSVACSWSWRLNLIHINQFSISEDDKVLAPYRGSDLTKLTGLTEFCRTYCHFVRQQHCWHNIRACSILKKDFCCSVPKLQSTSSKQTPFDLIINMFSNCWLATTPRQACVFTAWGRRRC